MKGSVPLMINNISYVSDSHSNEGMRLSLGEYNTISKTLRFWVYHTRMSPIDDAVTHKVIDRVVKIRDLQEDFFLDYLVRAEKIELVDLDWDRRWIVDKELFLEKEVVEGYRSFKLSELKEIK